MPRWLRYSLIFTFVCTLAWFERYDVMDDTFIYARYLRSALLGHGLVFNSGEHVNALTSPLYCYLGLAAAKLLFGNVLLALQLIFVSSFLAACFVAEELIRYSGIAVALVPYFYSMHGMETSLFLLLLTILALIYNNGHWDWLPTIYILLVLTRFEGAIFAACFFGFQMYRKKLPRRVAWVPVVIILCSYSGLNWHWYGHLLPASAGAKFGQGFSGYWGRWPIAFLSLGELRRVSDAWTERTVKIILTLGVFGAAHLLLRKVQWCGPIILSLALLLIFCICANIPHYPWYFAPFIFFSVIFVMSFVPSGRAWVSWLVAVSIVLCLVDIHFARAYKSTLGYLGDYGMADQWILHHAPVGSRVACAETGIMGWELQHYYIIDMVGLTTPKNALYTAHRQPTRWFSEDHPDYVVVHGKPWRWEEPVIEASEYTKVPVTFGDIRLYAYRGRPIQ